MGLFSKTLILLIIISISYFGWQYYQLSNSVVDIPAPDNCLTKSELPNYMKFKSDSFSHYIFKDWKKGQFNGISEEQARNFNTYVISGNDIEYYYTWSKGYAFDTNQLMYDTISAIPNNTILIDTEIKDYAYPYRRLLVGYNVNGQEMKQDAYGFVKDNKAYVLILRSLNVNYQSNYDRFTKAICSFRINN